MDFNEFKQRHFRKEAGFTFKSGIKALKKVFPRGAKIKIKNVQEFQQAADKSQTIEDLVKNTAQHIDVEIPSSNLATSLPKLLLGGGLLGLATYEAGSYGFALARKKRAFQALIESDPYLAENRDDAERLFNHLYRIAPRIMSNPDIAKGIMRKVVSVGTITPDIIRELSSLEGAEPTPYRILTRMQTGFKNMGGG